MSWTDTSAEHKSVWLGKVRKMDYHNLDCSAENRFDGAYRMETFAHGTDPRQHWQNSIVFSNLVRDIASL